MTTVLHAPHRIYKRYQAHIENGITAIGLALLTALVLGNIPVYPANWAPVLVALVAITALRWPLLAYSIAALSIAWPVYTVSLYLMVLYLAVVILAHRPLSHYLGATVLILSAPLLAKYQLHWAVPILAGLWWGSVNGFWIGGVAALWGKLFGGMAGLNIDWLAMAGQSPAAAGLMQRFHGLTALETLLKIVQPFIATPNDLLVHFLQIALWAAVAAGVGILASRKWLFNKYPWSVLIISGLGAIGLAAGTIAIALWLNDVAPATLDYAAILVGALLGLVVSGLLEVLRAVVDLPLTIKPPGRVRPVVGLPAEPATSASRPQATSTAMPVQLPDMPDWDPPAEDNGLILLELD